MQHRAVNQLHCRQTHCVKTHCRHTKDSVTYREDPLWVALGPHVGVMDLLQNHPRLVMLSVLEERNKSRLLDSAHVVRK